MKRLSIAILFSIVASFAIVVPHVAQAQCGAQPKHLISIGASFYQFTFDKHLHGMEADILPAHYTGPMATVGIHPFSCVSFQASYFENGNTMYGSLGLGDYGVYAQSNVHFRVWTAQANIHAFYIPWTKESVSVDGILSVNHISYKGTIDVGYYSPHSNGDARLAEISGEKAGPGIGGRIVYHPTGNRFSAYAQYVQYTYSNGSDRRPKADLAVIGLSYHFW